MPRFSGLNVVGRPVVHSVSPVSWRPLSSVPAVNVLVSGAHAHRNTRGHDEPTARPAIDQAHLAILEAHDPLPLKAYRSKSHATGLMGVYLYRIEQDQWPSRLAWLTASLYVAVQIVLRCAAR